MWWGIESVKTCERDFQSQIFLDILQFSVRAFAFGVLCPCCSVSLCCILYSMSVSLCCILCYDTCVLYVCAVRYSTYVCDCWIPLLCAAPLPSVVVVEPLAGCRQWSNYSGMWITLFMMMAPPMFFSVCTHPPHLKPHHLPLALLHPLIHFDQEFSMSRD